MRDGLLPRRALLDLLEDHLDVPVVLLSGPPGYGKTTLVGQWDDEDSRPFVWLSLDEETEDPVALVRYLVLALERIGFVDQGVLSALADDGDLTTVLLPRLGRALTHEEQAFVVVLDDVGRLSAPQTHEVLMTVARHLNDRSQLVLTTRRSPDLPWHQLQAERRLLALHQDSLRLTRAEARALLVSNRVELSDDDLDVLMARTEGWPLAVHLATFALRRTPRPADAAAAFGGPGGVLADHLRQTVLAGLPPDQRRFLVHTSVLPRLCGPLCDELLESTGSGLVLRDLERSNAFVTALDGREEWYRCHPLLRQVLQDELEAHGPGVVAALHSRAGRWHAAAGEMQEAVHQAAAAGEVDHAARLVWGQVASAVAHGRTAALRDCLEAFSTRQLQGHPKLSLTAAWCAVVEGRPAEQWLTAAERGLLAATRSDETQTIAAGLALLRAQRAHDGLPRMREDAALALGLQALGDPWRPLALHLHAVTTLLAGAPHDDVRATFKAAARQAAELAMPAPEALALAQLAAVAIEDGDGDTAGRHADAACAVLTDHGTVDTMAVGPLRALEALVLAKRGHGDEARASARHARQLVAAHEECPAWLGAQTRYLLGRTHLMLGDPAGARTLLAEAQPLLRGAPAAGWLATRLEDAWAHVESLSLAAGAGAAALTPAELRVLRLLPTHLSFEQISTQLSVSRNTVKTQAIAAYRKLGVASRGEAVDRATSLGLIQG